MWIRQILLAVIGSSAGAVAAGGLFAFIAELGVLLKKSKKRLCSSITNGIVKIVSLLRIN